MVELNSDRNISGYKMRIVIGLLMIFISIVLTGGLAYYFFKGFNKIDEGAENEL